MPTDVEILEFIFARMKNVHGENEHYDYMIHFKSVIERAKKVVKCPYYPEDPKDGCQRPDQPCPPSDHSCNLR